ncbi:hypothetical protein GC173_02305 [bacterium]|nr:hypothetical protein [bacterium]
MRMAQHRGMLLACLLALAPLAANAPAESRSDSRWPAAIVADPGQAERRQILVSHGITPLPETLIPFLRDGFPAPAPGQNPNLPSEPARKIDVVNAAIQELGLTGASAGVPVLLEIAQRKGPAGVSSILRRDVEDLPIESADQQVALGRRLLSLNAVVALGLIGDPSAEPVILDLMRTETGTAFITRGAEALSLMGLTSGIPPLVALASNPDSTDSVAAFSSIYAIAGRNYGYTANTPLARRRELIAELRAWAETPEASLAPQRADVIRRLNNPPQPVVVDPTSLRGILRASMDLGKLTSEDYDRRYEARRVLQETGKERFDELREIAQNPYEELDIRSTAMRWLAVSDPRKARSIIRALKKDENPAIAESARVIDQDLPEYIKQEKNKGS